MAELSEQQFENAREAYRKAYDEHPGQQSQSRDVALRAAAPFLQLPWDEPTDAEVDEICEMKGILRSASMFIYEFVRRRNAALKPKPVDPRREKIRNVLALGVDVRESYITNATERILAAIDEVK